LAAPTRTAGDSPRASSSWTSCTRMSSAPLWLSRGPIHSPLHLASAQRSRRRSVCSASAQSDSIKSDQCGRLMLALGDQQLSKKVDVRMASFRAEGDASRLRSASVENASLALRKNASPDEIHRLRLADIPWSLAAPGPHGKHVASNRLRDICVPRLLELFCENRRALPI
jgi:hypothetical protein